MKRICLGIFMVMALPLALNAQRYQDWVVLGDQAIADNDPLAALRYYENAMDLDSSKGDIQYRYADALRLNHYYSKASYYYYKVYRKEQGSIYPMGGFWLASMQKQSGNYQEAKQMYRRVRDQYSDNQDSYFYLKAVQEMRSCDYALLWSEDDDNGNLEPIDGIVNSSSSEFDGKFQSNGDIMFTSLRGEYDERGKLISDDYSPKLYQSTADFSSLIEIDPSLNGLLSFATNRDSSFWAKQSPDGEKRVITVESESGKQFIIPNSDTDTAWYSHPNFGSIDGEEVLFFSSNRIGGKGQEDIWYLFLNNPDEYINAGEEVNTPGSEICPFFRMDESNLYFASDWHFGFGGYDIFSSQINESTFAIVHNLKFPFNSRYNDLYYSFNESVGKGSVTSNRLSTGEEDGMGCCNDLWYFVEEREVEEPLISNLEDLNKYLPVTLYFHNDEPNPRTRDTVTNQTYLDTYKKYLDLIPVYEKQYRKGLSENKGNQAEEEMDKFFINKVDKGVSDLELFSKLLLDELEKGSRVELTVRGFASPLAETDYNVNLTSRRISSLVNYLTNYKSGVFEPYLENAASNGGFLRIISIPFGEYTAASVVSDNPNEANSIYGIGAALERKIEIVSVQQSSSDSTQTILEFDSEVANLGQVMQGAILDYNFKFRKSESCIIDSVHSANDNLEVSLVQDIDKGMVSISIDTSDLNGKQRFVVELNGNFSEQSKELNVIFEVR